MGERDKQLAEYQKNYELYSKGGMTVGKKGVMVYTPPNRKLAKLYKSRIDEISEMEEMVRGSRRENAAHDSLMNKEEVKTHQAHHVAERLRTGYDNQKYKSQTNRDIEKNKLEQDKAFTGRLQERPTQMDLEDQIEKKQAIRDVGGKGAYYAGKIEEGLNAIGSNSTRMSTALGNAVSGISKGVKQLDDQFFGLKPGEKAAGDRLREKVATGNFYGGEWREKRLLRKAAEADSTQRFQKRQAAIGTTKDIFGAVKDTVSSKSRARTLAERGTVGEKRREARIAYALGDRSLMTKLAAGKSFGSRNAFTKTVGKLPGYLMFGRREDKNRKNYARQLAYGGMFSELGSRLACMSAMSMDFDDTLVAHTGEGWQYSEYPELAKILDDDKYEKLDAKVLESGEFSEPTIKKTDFDDLDGNTTPPDGRIIPSDSLRPGREEVTVDNILNKNYYQAPALEKKFQEMLARGFSEEQSDGPTPYENFLNKFSDSAESLRKI